MNFIQTKGKIKLFKEGNELPYDLLLLADETIDAINKYIHDSEIYTYELEGETVGVYAYQLVGEDSIEIKNIAVSEKVQGEGIGQELLAHAIKNAKKRGFHYIFIGTANAAIKQLYVLQKMGFRFHEIRKNYYIEKYDQPMYEDGIQLNHQLVLRKELNEI
ncbi:MULTISPECIES: GNAT family N-acetyltransferase [Flammeovirga]|uniref:GNAT family N-acetyltransferase n=1 Tax=Flammeovirga agarivorans TaxID=2726742 RepID=A0A7X8SKB7_9BACT|nr:MULTISPECIES: GNAT family N-acetyltransferase [Flammeovirga]NLR91717.1 GNAT family N-acetyltransferase [Flammeovirga agarivorans]